MSLGKMCAQVAHASVGALDIVPSNIVQKWKENGMKKVVVQVDSLEDLEALEHKAPFFFVHFYKVRDAGHTELESGTVTCLALGPASESQLSKFTSKLKLL